jgi:3',5'-cyclic-AMP phosphodiesterase
MQLKRSAAETQMKLVQISDLHMVPDGDTLHGLDPHTRLQACISDINRRTADAELCVLTGDLADRGELAAYESLRRLLDTLPMPYVALIGNHDDRESFLQVFHDGLRDANGFVQGARRINDATLLFLDTHVPGSNAGGYCAERCDWLESQLRANAGCDTYLFMHHPPFDIGMPAMDIIQVLDSSRLRDLLLAANNIKHVFFGHVHRPVSGNWHGISYSSLPGTNHQMQLDFEAPSYLTYSHERPAYAAISLEKHQTIVHLQDFDDSSPRRQPDNSWVPSIA